MGRETVLKFPPTVGICQRCKVCFSLFMACLRLRDVKLQKDCETCLELIPCDFVALFLDPNEREKSESGSYLDLIRNCFHQSLALFGNGVSEHVLEAILGYSLVSQKDVDSVA